MILVIKGALDRIFAFIKVTKNNIYSYKKTKSKHNLLNIYAKDFMMQPITIFIEIK